MRKREFPRTAFITYLERKIKTWKSKGDQMILMGDINKYILSKRIRNFTTKLGPR